MQYQKAKPPGKIIRTKGELLTKKLLDTTGVISAVVGGTLGPGGQPVLIERYEYDFPPQITKDGVTVLKNLSFDDPEAQLIYEVVRDTGIKTANSAGDGTTTATILADAFIREIADYCSEHPQDSPQAVIRRLEYDYDKWLKPALSQYVMYPGLADFEDPESASTKVYKGVATVSTNGDENLANAVMKCFSLTGDYGNVTINEGSGQGYEVESIKGYQVQIGFEAIGAFYVKFINDSANQLCRLEKPRFVLYNGKIHQFDMLRPVLAELFADCEQYKQGQPHNYTNHDVVLVATGFSEQVLATCAAMCDNPVTANVYPLQVPMFETANGQWDFLCDLAAITGATLFDPLTLQLHKGSIFDLGPGVEAFEAHRWKTSIIGHAEGAEYEAQLTKRADTLAAQLKNPLSELDQKILQERLAQLSMGLACLTVKGSSTVEIRERKDRAEDAICAVKAAVRSGVLPGGASVLLDLSRRAAECSHDSSKQIFKNALMVPFYRLLSNAGIHAEEMGSIADQVSVIDKTNVLVYDALNHKMVNPFDVFLFDSTEAVSEAIKNSLATAKVLGTTGGIVAFARDKALDLQESLTANESYRNMREL